MTQSVFYALQFFWLGDRSTSSPFTPGLRALVYAGFVLPYSGGTVPGFHGILLYCIHIECNTAFYRIRQFQKKYSKLMGMSRLLSRFPFRKHHARDDGRGTQ